MRTLLLGLLSLVFAALSLASALAESPEPPLDNKRVAIHTLVREDIFAGWIDQDMDRFERGEKNIELLLEKRPNERAGLVAWKGGAKLYRAVLALEADDKEAFQKYYDEAVANLDEAKKLGPKNPGVAAIVGGSYLTFGDRLPEELRASAWEKAYENYQILWSQQGKLVDRLPVHIRGELLSGLVQSAHRTGRDKEYAEHLDKIIAVLPDTGYQKVALEWKENPQAAATGNISCKSCHAEGRLRARLAVIEGKK
jgi:tetratricopeptide (TPR) repeat protein